MIKCKVCGVGDAVVPDRDRPLSREKEVCRVCHGKRLMGDMQRIFSNFEGYKTAWEKR